MAVLAVLAVLTVCARYRIHSEILSVEWLGEVVFEFSGEVLRESEGQGSTAVPES